MRIASVQVGQPTRIGKLRTAYRKSPVAGPVRVLGENLEGDGQADRRYHGGADMAVLAYGADHYPAWREELSWPGLPLGGFGENLSVSGTSEATVCIGDVWLVGSALLQVASPRKPCRKISAFWKRPGLLGLVARSGRSGWYLRILREGHLQAGDEVALQSRPHAAWPVARANEVALSRAANRGAALELASVSALSERWKAWLRGEPARV